MFKIGQYSKKLWPIKIFPNLRFILRGFVKQHNFQV